MSNVVLQVNEVFATLGVNLNGSVSSAGENGAKKVSRKSLGGGGGKTRVKIGHHKKLTEQVMLMRLRLLYHKIARIFRGISVL